MKKKLLFLILLLIPFIVKAEDLSLVKSWDLELDNREYESFVTQDYYIKYRSREIDAGHPEFVSVNKLTGNYKRLSIEANYYFSIDNNKVLLFTKEDDSIVVSLYDEKLNLLHQETIVDIEIDYNTKLNDYILVSGNRLEDNSYTRYIYFFDSNGNIYKQDHIKTLEPTITYIDNDEVFFADEYNSEYLIENYQLVPKNKIDNNYFVSLGNKIVKLNSNGEEVGEVNIPTGIETRIAKKNNRFYLLSAVITGTNYQYKYQVVLYTLTPDLTLSAPTTPYPSTPINIPLSSENEAGRWVHNLLSINNKIYMDIARPNNTNGALYRTYYEVADDLSFTETTDVQGISPRYEKYEKFLHSNFETEIIYLNDDNILKSQDLAHNIPADEQTAYLAVLEPHISENKNYINGLSERKDANNNRLITIMYAKDPDGNPVSTVLERPSLIKLEVLYLDNNNQKIFSKIVFDWTNAGIITCNSKMINHDADFFNDYIVVSANDKTKNYIKFYDKQGNEVLDLSEDVNNYGDLSFYYMIPYKEGIYFEFTESRYRCLHGVSEIVNPNVLGANNDAKTYMVYYEIPFNVSTRAIGKGTVTSKIIRAIEGSQVEFTVTPDPGYVLSYVKVMDSNGNVLTFTNNTFVMPASDVVIEAVFVPYNPNTGNIAIITIGILAIASFAMVIYEKRKVNALK